MELRPGRRPRGTRLRVAEAILAAERLLGAGPATEPIAFLAFGGSTVPERVRSLLAEPLVVRRARTVWVGVGVAATAIALAFGADALHHATEHAIRLLLRAL